MRHAFFLAALLPVACGRVAKTRSDPLPHDVYVWQRTWTQDVKAGLLAGQSSMQRYVVFAGELTLTEKPARMVKPAIDYDALAKLGKPIGLAIRVDPFPGPFAADDVMTRTITTFVRERIAEARKHGIEPTELHFDFDCAESKLDGYRIWLRAVRDAVKPLPVVPTVLPSWLKHPSFAALARESGQYVLQVHCVAAPKTMADTARLTDPAKARGWVDYAGGLGTPFRVALPTYAYLVAFDAEGKPRGISAEGPSSTWSPDFQVVRWEADPAELALLVNEWTHKRPALMTGIIWYRLPVKADNLNWRWPTLEAAMAGRAPKRLLDIEATDGQPSDITLVNAGERDEPLPERIVFEWEEGATLVAADALAGYDVERQPTASQNQITFRREASASASRLSPGSRRPIGWIRCDKPVRIRPIGFSGVASAGSH
jgi:hypothetical protein